MKEFRDLREEDIDCRVQTVKDTGVSVLLYKNARVDMQILDETVGPLNWQRHHSRDNANCTVSIWDEDKKTWIEKEDTGTESNTEAEKGLASDSFKRACFNWGIGRELYTAPFIWIPNAQKNDRFDVAYIAIDQKRIVALKLRNAKTKAIVFDWQAGGTAKKAATRPQDAPKAEGAQTPDPKQNAQQAAQEKALEHFVDYGRFEGYKLRNIYKVEREYIPKLIEEATAREDQQTLDAIAVIEAMIEAAKK